MVMEEAEEEGEEEENVKEEVEEEVKKEEEEEEVEKVVKEEEDEEVEEAKAEEEEGEVEEEEEEEEEEGEGEGKYTELCGTTLYTESTHVYLMFFIFFLQLSLPYLLVGPAHSMQYMCIHTHTNLVPPSYIILKQYKAPHSCFIHPPVRHPQYCAAVITRSLYCITALSRLCSHIIYRRH